MIVFEIGSHDRLIVPERFADELSLYRKQAKKIRVTISPVFQKRSLNQNAIFHAKINELALITGMDRETVKSEIKEMAMAMGYPPETDELGNPMVSGDKFVALSSAKATVEQMTILINAIDMWCEQEGISLSEIWRNE